MLCQFDYPGNIRALRNLIYELTSYVEESESISIELVQFVLAKLNLRGGNPVMSRNDTARTSSSLPSNEITSTANATNIDVTAQHSHLRSIAHEGDIILPLELCVLRSGETFRQWTARAKRCSIEAARRLPEALCKAQPNDWASAATACWDIFIELGKLRTKHSLTCSKIPIAIRQRLRWR